MLPNFFHHRQVGSFMEHRLCHLDPPVAPPGGPRPGPVPAAPEDGRGWVDWIKSKALSTAETLATDYGKYFLNLEKVFLQLPAGVIRGLGNVWQEFPTKEEALMFLNRVGVHFRDFPVLGGLLGKLGAKVDIETLKHLMNHDEWIEAFVKNDMILTDPTVTPLPPADIFGPEKLLKALEPKDRQLLYVTYVEKFISLGVRQDMAKSINGVDAWGQLGNEHEKWNAISGNVNRYNDVLKGVMGMENAPKEDSDEWGWAYQSLQDDYFSKPGEPKRQLMTDVREGMLSNTMPPVPGAVDTTGAFLANVPPSRLRGALKMGLVQQADIRGELDRQHEIDRSLLLTTGSNARKDDVMRDATRRNDRKEAQSITDIWHGMSGNERLVLTLVGAYLVATSKGFRTAASAVVLGYFGMKFIAKVDDPLKVMSDMIDTGKGKIKELTKGWPLMPGNSPELYARLSRMGTFLSDFDRAYLGTQQLGFSILADVPMRDLASQFEIGGGPGNWQWGLHTEQGGQIDRVLGKAAEKYNWSKGYRAFFNDPSNAVPVSEAVGFAFYRKAAVNPANKPLVDKVELAIQQLPASSSGSAYAMLQKYANTYPDATVSGDPARAEQHEQERTKYQEAAQAYADLVIRGRTEALGDSQSLGDFVGGLVGIPKVTKREEPKKPAVTAGPTTTPPSTSGGAPGPTVEPPPAGEVSTGVAEGDVARRASDEAAARRPATGDASRRTADVAAERRSSTGDARRPPVEGDASRRASDAVADRRPATGDVVPPVAEGDVAGRPGEGDAARRAAEGAARRPTVESLAVVRKSEGDAQRMTAEATARRGDAEALVQRWMIDEQAARRAVESGKMRLADAEARRVPAEAEAVRGEVASAQRWVQTADALRRSAEAEVALRTAEVDVGRTTAEAVVMRRGASEAAMRFVTTSDTAPRDADAQAQAWTAYEGATRMASEAETARVAVADTAVRAAEAVVGERRSAEAVAKHDAEASAQDLQVAQGATRPDVSRIEAARRSVEASQKRALLTELLRVAAEAEVALKQAEAHSVKAEVSVVAARGDAAVLVAKHAAAVKAGKPSAEVDAAKSAADGATRKLAEAEGNLTTVEADVAKKRAAADQARQAAEAAANR